MENPKTIRKMKNSELLEEYTYNVKYWHYDGHPPMDIPKYDTVELYHEIMNRMIERNDKWRE